MRKVLIALIVAASPAMAQTKSSEEGAVLATVSQFIDGFNNGDAKTAVAACAEETSIIDEFPPFEWHGAGACMAWANDFDAFAKTYGFTDALVSMDKPRHITVASDRAYVVALAGFTYKEKGKLMKQSGSTFTVALKKGEAGWRITGWSWSTN